jgi:hypothetical protein
MAAVNQYTCAINLRRRAPANLMGAGRLQSVTSRSRWCAAVLPKPQLPSWGVRRPLAVSRVASRVRSQSLRGQQNLFVSA